MRLYTNVINKVPHPAVHQSQSGVGLGSAWETEPHMSWWISHLACLHPHLQSNTNILHILKIADGKKTLPTYRYKGQIQQMHYICPQEDNTLHAWELDVLYMYIISSPALAVKAETFQCQCLCIKVSWLLCRQGCRGTTDCFTSSFLRRVAVILSTQLITNANALNAIKLYSVFPRTNYPPRRQNRWPDYCTPPWRKHSIFAVFMWQSQGQTSKYSTV